MSKRAQEPQLRAERQGEYRQHRGKQEQQDCDFLKRERSSSYTDGKAKVPAHRTAVKRTSQIFAGSSNAQN